MKTIEEIALGTKFSENHISGIMEICGATQNPRVSMQILLGIYEAPFVAEAGLRKMSKGEDRVMWYSLYDKWTDAVTYSYDEYKTLSIYVHKDTDAAIITPDNYQDFKISWNDDAKHHTVVLKELVTKTDSCSYAQWCEWAELFTEKNKVTLEDFGY